MPNRSRAEVTSGLQRAAGLAFVAMVSAGYLVPRLEAANGYDVVILGDLGGQFGRARMINDFGLIIGESLLPASEGTIIQRAVLWQSGVATDLGTLGGVGSAATSLAADGTVGGWAQDETGRARPVLWDQEGIRQLPTLGGASGAVWGVNDLGLAAGGATLPSGDSHAALWHGSGITDLGTLGGDYSVAYDVNNAGSVVGSAADVTGRERATVWQGVSAVDLGNLSGGEWSAARGVNESGEVILWGRPAGVEANRAAFWSGDVGSPVIDLGTFGGAESWAFGLNSSGVVVGWAGTSAGGYHAFVWNGATMTDLGTLGGFFSAAYGINDQGIIVGAAHDANGVTHAVAWVPVPEPPASMLLAFGIPWLLAVRRPGNSVELKPHARS